MFDGLIERNSSGPVQKRNYNQLLDLLRLEQETFGAVRAEQPYDPEKTEGMNRDWNGTHNWTKPPLPKDPRHRTHCYPVAWQRKAPKPRTNAWVTSSDAGPPAESKPQVWRHIDAFHN